MYTAKNLVFTGKNECPYTYTEVGGNTNPHFRPPAAPALGQASSAGGG